MATADIDRLRALTDGAVGITDADLQLAIEAEGGVKQAAVHVWRVKAGSYSTLVNISESGSSRNLGDLQKQALTMAETLSREVAAEVVVETGSTKRSRRAVRR